ncbi:MAG: histone deacetylase family protein [Promethearchaeota archaeon]
MQNNPKIGIIYDDTFIKEHIPPSPKPVFISYENPFRIKFILEFLKKRNLFQDPNVLIVNPQMINDSILKLAHSDYHINTIRNLSERGGRFLGDEIFLSENSYHVAKMAVAGAIKAVESIVKKEYNFTFALIRPPGHHAVREKPSGLCLFNNIALAIYYLREKMKFNEKIAIIDIDNHFGDGLCQYFYEDPSVLYFSIHEFDFIEGDVGYIDELGEGKGEGTNINFPVPPGITDNIFLEFFDLLNHILEQYKPGLIIVAAGFDMYFADPIGNCNLTSYSYYNFAKKIIEVANRVCNGKISFILEGGYSLIGLPYCVYSIIRAMLNQKYKRPDHEFIRFKERNRKFIVGIKKELINLLKKYWNII